VSKEKTSFVYVTYIRSTPEKVFEAITKPEIARRYSRESAGKTLRFPYVLLWRGTAEVAKSLNGLVGRAGVEPATNGLKVGVFNRK
jgi:uncharacterized protein YndB with AHSA1/START domain